MTTTSPPPTEELDDTRAAAPAAPAPTKLSGTQIVASALAAVSTTVALSYFGIAGTIIGAGAASVLTVVANFLYTRSIEKTHAQLRPVVGQMVRPRPARPLDDGAPAAARVGPAGSTATVDAVLPGNAPDVDGAEAAGTKAAKEEGDETPPSNVWLRLIRRHGTVRVLAASAAVVFVAVMGVVLAVELIIGKPLADAVQGQEGSGTSISRTVGGDSSGSSGSSEDSGVDVDGGIDRAGRETGTTQTDGSGTGDSPTGSDGDRADEQDAGTSTGTDESDSGSEPTPEPTPEETGPTEPVEPTEPTEPTDPTEPEDTGDGSTDGSGSISDGTGSSPSVGSSTGGDVPEAG